MQSSFYANRPFIENEFENAEFDASTGIDPAVLYESLKEMSDAPTDDSRPIVHAKLFSYLLDNVQLQINEHTPFSVKLNFGIDYTNFATSCILQKAISKAKNQARKEILPIEYAKFSSFAAVGLDWMGVDFTHTIPNWSYLLEHAKRSRSSFWIPSLCAMMLSYDFLAEYTNILSALTSLSFQNAFKI